MPVEDPEAQVPKPVLDAFFRQMKMANDEKVTGCSPTIATALCIPCSRLSSSARACSVREEKALRSAPSLSRATSDAHPASH
jgi:hypothetical protein